jgi:signal transduction histidine kinase
VLTALDQAMEHVRALSQELNVSPVDRVGLRHALLRIAEQDPRVQVTYSTTATLPREAASVVYAAVAGAIQAAVNAGAQRIRVSITGAKGVRVRVADNGRAAGRARSLAVTVSLAQAAGVVMTVSTIESTIVSISYALRSPAGR